MRKLTARHFRWASAAVGCAFLVALLLSDFFSAMGGGAAAIDTARLQLFVLDPGNCPPGRFCLAPVVRPAVFLIDVPINLLAAATVVVVLALLFMASQRERRDSN